MKSRKPGNESSPVRPRPAAQLARSKPPVMNAPFDHLYACHLSEQSVTDSRPRIAPATEKSLTERLNRCSKENRMLKNLLLVNLDLVQQQSDRIVNKDKTLLSLKRENAALKSRIDRMNRRSNAPRSIFSSLSPPAAQNKLPSSTQTSKAGNKPSTSQVALNKYTELLITDNPSKTATTTVDSNLDKTKNCYFPSEGEYLHIPEILKECSAESKKSYFYPKDELADFLNLSDINSLLKNSESDLSKPKNCFFSADDEFLLDVTSLDSETEIKAKDTSFDKETTGFLHIPEVTAADRLKQSINREIICKETIRGEPLRRETVPPSMSTKKREGVKSRSVSGLLTHMTFPQLPSQRPAVAPSTIKSRPPTKTPSPLKLRASTLKAKAESMLHSQFYKSRNCHLKSQQPETPAVPKTYESSFTVNKKSKMIHTYGKSSKNRDTTSNERGIFASKKLPYTGSLSDRLKLIDTTPTGEDPYQLGEAEMREQSPIPKLMLQKNHPNKTKIFCGDNYTCTSETMKLLDSSIIGENRDGKAITKIKLNKYNMGTPYMYPGENDGYDDSSDDKIDLELGVAGTIPELASVETQVDLKSPKVEASVCDFSYGESSRNIASRITFENDDYTNLFSNSTSFSSSSAFNQDLGYILSIGSSDSQESKASTAKRNDAVTASDSLLKKKPIAVASTSKCSTANKSTWIRKQRLSSSSSRLSHSDAGDAGTSTSAATAVAGPKNKGKGKGKSLVRSAKRKVSGKKSPPPPMMIRGAYHTTLGDAESSWYLGRDPDVEPDDNLPRVSQSKQKTIEVPRWREKVYTSCYTMEGTENLDDEIFRKRHQKGEKEEKRLKRWDLQRQREQVVVERLRRRQQDAPWYNRSGADNSQSKPPHTLNQRRLSDIQVVEIVDEMPVSAFGEIVPALPQSDFYLPWVRSSQKEHEKERKKD